MGSSAVFGFNSANNNAPPPPGPLNNPTGVAPAKGGNNGGIPNFPAISPSANAPIFGATNIGGLSSGLTGDSQTGLNPANGSQNQLQWQLAQAYGAGTGSLLYNLITQGTFNPQVASSFLNAMQPSVNRGNATIEQAFGAEGSRFGSAAALGLGDYNSQVNLNEQQTLASMFMQSQSNELSLLSSVLPTIHTEKANSSGILGDILGGLEVVGGAALAIGSAGTLAGPGIALAGAGVGTIAGANGEGGGGGAKTNPMNIVPPGPQPTFGGSPNINNAPNNGVGNTSGASDLDTYLHESTAASALGGGSDAAGDYSSGLDPALADLFQQQGIVPFF